MSYVSLIDGHIDEPKRAAMWIYDGEFKTIALKGAIRQFIKTGRLSRTTIRLVCSNCHKCTLVDDTIYYNYCPHCGEKMDSQLLSKVRTGFRLE